MTPEPAIFEPVDEAADEAADIEALAELQTEPAISHEAMKAWLSSWGKPDELQAPRAGS